MCAGVLSAKQPVPMTAPHRCAALPAPANAAASNQLKLSTGYLDNVIHCGHMIDLRGGTVGAFHTRECL